MSRHKKLRVFCFLIVSILLFLATDAIALGVTPGKRIVDFELGREQSYEFSVLNNEKKDVDVVIYKEGDLKDLISLDKSEFSFKGDEDSELITYKMNFPNEKYEPGTHPVRLVVSEVVSPIEGDKVYTIRVKTEIVHQVDIRIPFPGKYLKNEFFIVEKEDDVDFLINSLNLGKEDISESYVTFEIYGLDGSKITTLNSDKKSVNRRETREFISRWGNYSAGSYTIRAIVNYDGERKILERNISLGNFQIKILDLFVEDFRLGSIAQFNLLVENTGNDAISDLYSTLVLHDYEGGDVANLKSASIFINPKERQKMLLYWDTKNVRIGTYEGKLALFYGDESLEKQVRTRVREDKIDVEVVGVTGAIIGGGGISNSANYLLMGIGIIFVLFIIWRVFIRKRKT